MVKIYNQGNPSQYDSLTEADYGTCLVRFIVNRDGSVSERCRSYDNEGNKLAEVAVNAIKNDPKWTPASQKGMQ